MPEPALLELDGVEAGFGARAVLHGIDLSVPAGSAVGLFGLNGAGKSVTMKVIAGLVPARAGTVRFQHRDITALATEDRMRSGMAYVPQGRQLFPELTVAQNLRLGGAVRRCSPSAGPWPGHRRSCSSTSRPPVWRRRSSRRCSPCSKRSVPTA